tara:strand:- start:939 stop:1703 length:765 start_codon:yes stop_codon:yes gene_type:complete
MDIRFARTIERLQKITCSELTKIAIIHLYAQGYEDKDLVNFELELTAPSIIYDQQKVAIMNEKIQLAQSMKDSKLVSHRYIYEYIFNMSEEDWLQERNDINEDIKLGFRQNQIEQEGNDPTVTGRSYGTPHDLATAHMSSNDVVEPDKGGRPPEGIKSGQHKNAFGWDPLGTKQIKQDLDPENRKSAFVGDNRFYKRNPKLKLSTTEQLNILKKIKPKSPKIISEKIISETLNTEQNNTAVSSMLDENNILTDD